MILDSKLCCLSMIVLLTLWSLKVDSQIIVSAGPRLNPWLYVRRPLPTLVHSRMLHCADVICPDPNTRCVDAGGAQPPKCVDPCQGGIRRGCPRIYLPICGTDGVVYSNTCYLEAAMCLNRTLDVCVITSGECKDRRCATTSRTGMASSEDEDTNYAVSTMNYYREYSIAPNEKLVDTSINVGKN